MKVTKQQLKQIIKEELSAQIDEGEGTALVAEGKKEVWDVVQNVLRKSQGYFGPSMMAKYLQELAAKVTSSEHLTGFVE